MSHLPFTIAAYLLNACSVTIDKFLLTKKVPDPLIYVFYFSVVSLLGLLLLPLTHFPNMEALILASISTLLWTTGAYFMFKALQIGQVSRVIPLIGTLIPLILLSEAVVRQTIGSAQIYAVLVLILGIIFLTLPDWRGKILRSELIFIFLSALFFAISYVILRQAYLKEEFLTVFVWSRPVLVVLGLVILVIPNLRRRVFRPKHETQVEINPFSKTGVLFFSGQVCGGISELLLTFSVSLAEPALVNSLQGVQYVFLFLFSIFLSKSVPDVYGRILDKKVMLLKSGGIFFIGVGLYLLAFSNPS